MESNKTNLLRDQLLERRHSLETAVRKSGENARIARLLQDVDAALERMADGSYGLCEVCHEDIEQERLLADPLICTCLDHLTVDQQRTLEEDLDLARRIQSKLLPRTSQAINGWEIAYHYQPAGPVSGDYCDLVMPESNGDELFLLLGDISGKGIAASMLMTHLHAIFRSLISVGIPADQLTRRANRIFCESTISTHYATLVVVRVDKSGGMEICNAGHCQPLFLRSGEVMALEATGLPIGMFCESEYAMRKIKLSPGDSILLYTDGFTEARDKSDTEYGMERLLKLAARYAQLAPQELIQTCLKDLEAFQTDAAGADDLTIMVIRRQAW